MRPTYAPYGLFAISDRSRIRRVGILPTIARHLLEQTMIEAGDAHDDHFRSIQASFGGHEAHPTVLSSIGNIPPAEAEAIYHAKVAEQKQAA